MKALHARDTTGKHRIEVLPDDDPPPVGVMVYELDLLITKDFIEQQALFYAVQGVILAEIREMQGE